MIRLPRTGFFRCDHGALPESPGLVGKYVTRNLFRYAWGPFNHYTNSPDPDHRYGSGAPMLGYVRAVDYGQRTAAAPLGRTVSTYFQAMVQTVWSEWFLFLRKIVFILVCCAAPAVILRLKSVTGVLCYAVAAYHMVITAVVVESSDRFIHHTFLVEVPLAAAGGLCVLRWLVNRMSGVRPLGDVSTEVQAG